MRKTIIWLVIFILFAYVIYKITKKATGLTKLEFDTSGIDFGVKNIADASKFAIAGSTGSIDLLISNFSNEVYTIDNIYIELYSPDGQNLLAYQTAPLSNKINIAANANTTVKIPFYFKTTLASQLLSQLHGSIFEILQKYYQTGKLGIDLNVKGYASKGSAKIPIAFTKHI